MRQKEPTDNFADEVAAALNDVATETRSASALVQLAKRGSPRRRISRVPPWVHRLASTTAGAWAGWGAFRCRLVAKRDEFITVSVSLGLHILIAIVLAMQVLDFSSGDTPFELIVTNSLFADREDQPTKLVELDFPKTLEPGIRDQTMRQVMSEMDCKQSAAEQMSLFDRDFEIPWAPAAEAFESTEPIGHFGARTAAGKRAALAKYGGTGDSEKAVHLGLKWLAAIQRPDGSWSFADVGNAGSPGTLDTTEMGATSLALLCFLGTGQTHRQDGPHRELISNGLAYLLKNASRDSAGTDLRGRAQGNSAMYVQGLATICLCEASAMEPEDKDLRRVAVEAVAFVERTQDPIGGGWRYRPRQEGDTSVVGWQLMALQSAKVARIRVSGTTLRDARLFLDSVQADGGAYYGYMRPQINRPTTTAVGLLCRMYLGWKREHPGLKRGVESLARSGPSREDIYYNYYATQVLRHFGGPMWDEWNPKMRQFLVETQTREGPGAGSWSVTDPHGSGGGRIYQTALSILTLEVYYRHLPLYRDLDSGDAPDLTSVGVGP